MKDKGRILVVDDDEKVRKLLFRLLEQNDYFCVCAEDAETALVILEGDVFDVGLIDLVLPQASGFDLLEKIRLQYPDTYPIVLTGTGDVQKAIQAAKLGAFDFLEKPWHPDLLLRTIERAVEQRRMRLHLEQAKAFARHWEAALDANPDLVILTDLKGTLVRCNRSAARYAERDEEEMIGMDVHQAFCLENHPPESCPFRLISESDETVAGEHFLWGKTFAVSSTPLKDKKGVFRGMMFQARDITEKKRVRDALKENESRLKAILDSILTGVLIMDPDTGKVLDVNLYALEKLGVTREDIIGGDFNRFFDSPSSNPGMEQYCVNVTEQERFLLCPDGRRIPILENACCMTANDHGLMIESFLDISRLKEIETTLRSSEEKYRQIVEHIGLGVCLIDSDMQILDMNRQMREWFPSVATDGVSVCYRAFPENPRSDPCPECPTHKTLLEGKVNEGKMHHFGSKGMRHFRIIASPIHDTDGRVTAAIEMVEDITDWLEMERQLSQSQKLESIGQLAAGIAHEINTPTQFISDNTRFLQDGFKDLEAVLEKSRNMLEVLKQTGAAPEDVSEMESLIEESDLEFLLEEIPTAIERSLVGLERVSKIVRAMKDFSHPAGEEPTLLDINRAIESTVTVARNEWKYVSELTTEFDEELPLVPCLPGPFNQVILNMVINAAHAIAEKLGSSPEKKGSIVIQTGNLNGEWVEIRISDTGTGIPEEIRDRIFDPFFTTKGVGKGTGQGLAIAYSVIVEKHKGTIRIASDPGQGTTFIVRLPLGREADE